MINILFLSDSRGVSGAEKVLLSLARHLNRRKFRLFAAVPSGSSLQIAFEESGISTFKIDYHFRYPALRYIDHVRIAAKLLSVARRTKANIVYCNRAIVGKYGSIIQFFTGIPCIWHLHDLYENFLGDRLAEIATQMISVSLSVKNSFPGHLQSRIKVIYNGVERVDTTTSPLESQILALKSEFRIGRDEKVVSILGRITPWKGQHVFLEAARIVNANRQNIKFLIVGDVFQGLNTDDTNYKDKLIQSREKFALNDSVVFTGWRSDITAILALSDILVNASVKPEPLGTTILEAMAMGRPVICSDLGGSSEIVQNGINGFLFRPGDPHALADAIESMLNDPTVRSQMGARGLRIQKEKFSVSGFVANIEGVLTEIAN
jgi:glycosyltransferase involved in cell wall biosynthesis